MDPKEARRVHGHEAAFLVPVPVFYTPTMAGCVVVTGAVVDKSRAGRSGGSGGCAAVRFFA